VDVNVLPGRRLVAGVVGLLVVAGLGTAGPAIADDGGNSANAEACQHGGWRDLRRSDGSEFANQGDCVSYGAQGGVIEPEQNLQAQWEAVCTGGGWDVATINPDVQWSCHGGGGGPVITEEARTAMDAICLQRGWRPNAHATAGGYDAVTCNKPR
jgi:hypothetical protein